MGYKWENDISFIWLWIGIFCEPLVLTEWTKILTLFLRQNQNEFIVENQLTLLSIIYVQSLYCLYSMEIESSALFLIGDKLFHANDSATLPTICVCISLWVWDIEMETHKYISCSLPHLQRRVCYRFLCRHWPFYFTPLARTENFQRIPNLAQRVYCSQNYLN